MDDYCVECFIFVGLSALGIAYILLGGPLPL